MKQTMVNYNANNFNEEIDLKEISITLWRGKIFIVLVYLMFVFSASSYLQDVERKYTVEYKFIIDTINAIWECLINSNHIGIYNDIIENSFISLLIENYVNEKKEDQFFVEDFARYAKFPLVQIQHFLMDLANKGFLFYDFGEERITVLPSLSRYVMAKSKQGDYDVIQFNSKVVGNSLVIVNAALNIK